jgi:hypothetical protein
VLDKSPDVVIANPGGIDFQQGTILTKEDFDTATLHGALDSLALQPKEPTTAISRLRGMISCR